MVFYKCFYFYFFPFVILMINNFSPVCTTIPIINTLGSLENQGHLTYTTQCFHDNKFFFSTIFSEDGMWKRPDI